MPLSKTECSASSYGYTTGEAAGSRSDSSRTVIMEHPPDKGVPALAAPRFYLTVREPLRPMAIVIAMVAAVSALSGVMLALSHAGKVHLTSGSPGAAGSPSTGSGTSGTDDDKDDPDQIDTIVLGDPSDAPVPGRRGDHVSPVHPTILVRLPRFGDQVGLIPDSAPGRLLYGWLAAFNKPNPAALGEMLPEVAVSMQMELRRETGGFNLLSAKEAQPGVIVFRLRDQTPAANEVLGTLQMVPGSNPAAIASFSLRGFPSPHRDAAVGDGTR
jgi:hypothetical protein